MRQIFALLALVTVAAPSFACGNDSELPRAEREFRSSYFDVQPTEGPTGTETYSVATLGVAGLLLTGATVVTLRRSGR